MINWYSIVPASTVEVLLDTVFLFFLTRQHSKLPVGLLPNAFFTATPSKNKHNKYLNTVGGWSFLIVHVSVNSHSVIYFPMCQETVLKLFNL